MLILLTLVLLLACPGCGTLANLIGKSQDAVGFQTEGAPAVEPEPKIPAELMERVREQIDYARAILEDVRSEWITVQRSAVDQAVSGLRFALAVLDQPARPIEPGPDLNTPNPTVDAALSQGQGLLEDHREEREKWRDGMAEASRRPATRSWRLWSGPLWMYVTFGVGGVGTALLAVGRKLWAYRKGFLQLVAGGAGLISGNPVAGAAMKAAMLGGTDPTTQKLVQKAETRQDVQAQAAKIARNVDLGTGVPPVGSSRGGPT